MSEKQSRTSAVCHALRPFGTSIFTEMTALAQRSGALNLSQGFPDFEGPIDIRRTAAEAILRGPNQYVSSIGIAPLRQAIADKMSRFYNVTVDPNTQVTVTAGATEALAATLLGLLNPGDEVILLEPCYDAYPPIIARAGARAVYVSMSVPDFDLDTSALARAFNARTKAIVINNPHNPSGKVFTERELAIIADLCASHNVVAIGDEVYEHILYDGRKHTTLLAVPGLEDRSIVISSTAKTFSTTGWKIGYGVASPDLSQAVRMSHQFLTFCTPGALQEAMAGAIGMADAYYEDLTASYTAKRQKLLSALDEMGLTVLWPKGTYYASIDINDLGFEDDLEMCRFLATQVGVAAVPASFFWKDRSNGKNLVRLCFCKTDDTIDAAIERLKRWKR